MDESILRVLSRYEYLTPLQLWYEVGEDDAVKETVTEEEILSRLESLRKKGLVERVTEAGVDGDSAPLTYRVKTRK
ncbi:MAG: hypothetical protein GTN80_04230 [Nitrososphaeria archaeon]|nr:hypothetical protein [Nitrososphaeria archaeon]NIN52359.1 hypothetical protein [Nitrososphaeria archaeon]NIQ32837.1 hypothetical protein [Nitrososphaeria archaeon]